MTKTIEFTERGILLPPEIMDDFTRREFLIGGAGLFLPSAALVGENG